MAKTSVSVLTIFRLNQNLQQNMISNIRLIIFNI